MNKATVGEEVKHKSLVLPNALGRYSIGHRKGIQQPTEFLAQALLQSESTNCGLRVVRRLSLMSFWCGLAMILVETEQ